MTPLLWTLVAIQIAMGVFDTFYHHELTERLAWRPSQRYELQLHSLRNMLYALLFLRARLAGGARHSCDADHRGAGGRGRHHADGFRRGGSEPASCRPSERINHTLLAINYGAILVLLLPVLIDWARQPTGIALGLCRLPRALSRPPRPSVRRCSACAISPRPKRLARMTSAPAATLVEKLPRRQTVLVTGADRLHRQPPGRTPRPRRAIR